MNIPNLLTRNRTISTCTKKSSSVNVATDFLALILTNASRITFHLFQKHELKLLSDTGEKAIMYSVYLIFNFSLPIPNHDLSFYFVPFIGIEINHIHVLQFQSQVVKYSGISLVMVEDRGLANF